MILWFLRFLCFGDIGINILICFHLCFVLWQCRDQAGAVGGGAGLDVLVIKEIFSRIIF